MPRCLVISLSSFLIFSIFPISTPIMPRKASNMREYKTHDPKILDMQSSEIISSQQRLHWLYEILWDMRTDLGSGSRSQSSAFVTDWYHTSEGTQHLKGSPLCFSSSGVRSLSNHLDIAKPSGFTPRQQCSSPKMPRQRAMASPARMGGLDSS